MTNAILGSSASQQSIHEIASRCQFAYRTVARVDRRHFWYVTRNERISNYIKRRLPAFQTAAFLDVGCGCANVTGYLYENGIRNITGWDINPSGIEICRARYPQVNFQLRNFLSDLEDSTKFDAVGIFDCVEHVSDDVQALKHLRTLLKPGGRIFITVPAMNSLWSKMDDYYGHFRRYTKRTLVESMLSSGFRQVECNYMMAPLVPILMVRRKLRQIPDCRSAEEVDGVLSRDARLPNFLTNEVLKLILRCEERILGDRDLGCGSSLIATAIS